MGLNKFIKSYTSSLSRLLEEIDIEIVTKIVERFEQTIQEKSTIYMIGNGGSAATASHWSNDFSIGLKRRGIINYDVKSLVDNVPICTAIANDLGYENIFLAQLEDILKPEDVIFAISCSGNSPNIINAAEYAKEIGATVISLTGFSGGKLKGLSDINFHVQTDDGEYGLVEDAHMVLNHIIYSYYIQKNKDD